MVEYALILALFVIGLIGLLRGIEDSAGDDLANEFDCVSERPPPESCLKRAVVTTTTTTAAATTSTSAPAATTTSSTTTTSTTSTTSTTAPPASAVSVNWSNVRAGTWDGDPVLYSRFFVNGEDGLPGRIASFEVRTRSGATVAHGTCPIWPEWTGRMCYFGTVSVPDDAGDLQVVITGISGAPPVDPPTEGSPWLSFD